jgi:hypothetical protein
MSDKPFTQVLWVENRNLAWPNKSYKLTLTDIGHSDRVECYASEELQAEIDSLRDAVRVLGEKQNAISRLRSAESEYDEAKQAGEPDSVLDELGDALGVAMERYNKAAAAVESNPIAAAAVKGTQ